MDNNWDLKNVSCPLCDKQQLLSKYSRRHVDNNDGVSPYSCIGTQKGKPEILKCRDCGHEFSNPLSWPKNLASEYSEVVDIDYFQNYEIKLKTFKKAYSKIEKYIIDKKSILEIGSYYGTFLHLLDSKILEANVVGIEPSKHAIKYMNSIGLNCIEGSYETVLPQLEVKRFDAVISWDVIEHVSDPKQYINYISRVSKDKAILIISTIDRSSIFAKVLGNYWPWIVDMHLHYFSSTKLIEVVENAGYRFITKGNHTHYATISYALKKLFNSKNRIFDLQIINYTIPFSFGDVKYYVFEKY
jgi:2-polyprenyl-3-methyl-5-hydroxy-6-metoxy-1,4-benzoquinol methylase